VISGSRGSGKTTLIELIGAARRPTSGEILVAGRRLDLLDDRGRLEFRTANVALAPQEPTLAPTWSAFETVLQASRTSHTPRPDGWARTCLEALDLDKEADVLAADLSADGQQRLSVARALAKDAPLLLLDEPLAATGVAARARLLAAVPRLIGRAATVVLTASAQDDVSFADRVVPLAAA
jgi:ABC-type lipoprotein export system ATPase subunit